MPELNDKIKELMSEIEQKGDFKAVFGEPIKEDGVTIIPVATIVFVEGWRGVKGDEDEEEKPGLLSKFKGKMRRFGKIRKARPVGYIKIQDDDAKFVPIIDRQKIAMIVAPVVGMGLTMLAIAKLLLRTKIKHGFLKSE